MEVCEKLRGAVVVELSTRCYLAAGGGGNPPGDRGRAGQGVATLGTTPALHANEEPHSPEEHLWLPYKDHRSAQETIDPFHSCGEF